jgi:hypothetical protein
MCRREYDDRFSVFVPPHPEGFDSIECAQRAAAIWGAAELAPVVLPTIEVVPARTEEPTPAAAVPKRRFAALAALALIPSQAALAGGVGLAAAGSAASIYLAARPIVHSPPVAVATGTAPAAAPSPKQVSTGSAAAPSRGAVSGQGAAPPEGRSRGALLVDRPSKAAAARSVTTSRRAHPVHLAVAAKQHAVHPFAGSLVHSSASTTETAQFVSEPAVTHPHSSTPPSAPKPEPKAKPKPDPAPAKPHQPKAPEQPNQPKPKPPTTEPPSPPPAEPVSTARVEASVDSSTPPQPEKSKKKQSQPQPQPEPAPPQSPQPAQAQPAQPSDNDGETRPGNGYGDDNHDHTGPPGHDQHDDGEDGGRHGNGHDGDSQGDHGNHGDNHGDHGHGNGH